MRTAEVVGKTFGTARSKAEKLLDFARNLQIQAKAKFNLHRYNDALRLTLAARQAARKALELALGFELTPDNVKHALNRTDELITKVSTLIQKTRNTKVSELYRIALDTQRSAKESFQAHHLLVSLKLTLSARRMIMRLNKMAQEISADEVKRALSNTDRLLTKVMKTDPRREKAEMLQTDAYEQYHRGHQIEAYRLTKQAQRILYSILKDYERVNPQAVKRAIDETERLLGLTDMPSSERVRIKSLLEEARDLYKQGQYREALIKVSAAKRILDKLIED